MNSRILIIYEYQILYQVLNELSKSLNFEIIQSNSKDLKEFNYDPKCNYLIIRSRQCWTRTNAVSSSTRSQVTSLLPACQGRPVSDILHKDRNV